MEVMFKMLSHDAQMPTKATKGAIAFDLRVPRLTKVKSGRQVIPLDFAIEMPVGWEFKIEPRSGFSCKGMEGYSDGYVKAANIHAMESYPCDRFDADVIPGKVDSDYRGNVGVIISNHGEPFWLMGGERIAQGTFYHSPEDIIFVEVSELGDTDRGDGGFGHTGVK